MAMPERARLTPEIAALVATDRLRRPPLGRLTPAQADQLVSVIRREREYDEPVSVPRAIVALAAGQPRLAMPILAEILGSTTAAPKDRLAAAEGLGLVASPDAERVLLAAAPDRDPLVQQAVFAALGRFGGPAVVRQLSAVQVRDPNAHKQLVLTRALVAHRHELLNGPFLPQVAAGRSRLTESARTNDLTLRTKTPEATAADRRRLHGTTYGIQLAPRSLGLQCGRREWTIFVNAEIGQTFPALVRLTERPWIAAVLSLWYPVGIRTTTQYVLLTRPVGDGAHLDVVRADGEVMYTGSTTVQGATTSFKISETDRPGTAPARLSGHLGPEGVELDIALAATLRVDTRTTAQAQVS